MADDNKDKPKEGTVMEEKKEEKEEAPVGQQRAAADYTGTSLKFFHALGFKKNSNKNIEHVNDESLVYLVGKHVAIFNYDNKAHRFILKNSKTAQIVAFCVSSNRRYIALSEKLIDDGAIQVSVYNFNTATRVRTLSFAYLSKQPVVAMDFSRDNKYLVAVTQPPDVFIYLWQLDKARLLGMVEVNFSCTRVSISPWAHWKLCTTGTDTLRIWHYADKQLKGMDPLQKKKDYRFTCHGWFDDEKMVVGTEEGDILILAGENDRPMELKKTLQSVHETAAIWSICAIGRGFVCGGDGGHFTLFERTYDGDYFQLYKRFRMHEKQRIIDISISPNEENVVCAVDSNEMVFFSLANVDIMKSEDASNFKSLPIGFHHDMVTAIDVCVQKSIVVTAALDKSVHVWNYLKKQLEVVKTFDEEALSVACHPTGLRVVIGFKYRMCMFNLLVNDLHLCSDFPVKNCREVRFSHGGQYFAAVVVNRILIFSTYNFDCIGSLQGHSSMVKSICWTKNDTGLVSAGFEGAVYEWKIDGMKREDADDNVMKSTAYSCLCYDDATSMIAAIGSNKVAEAGAQEGEISLRQISKGQELRCIKPGVISVKQAPKTHSAELAICALSQTIFVGTPNGQLLLYKWPLPENAQAYQKYDIHQGEILFVRLSPDEKYLFTMGDDNSLFMFDVDIIVEGRPVSRKSFNYSVFDDVSYILQHELDERTRSIESLRTQLDDVMRDRDKELSRLKNIYEEEKKTHEDQFRRTTDDLRLQMGDAIADRDRAKLSVIENEKQLEALHMKAAEELEGLYQKRSEEQYAKYQQLKEEKDDLVVRYENKIYKLQKQKEEEIMQLVDQHKAVTTRTNHELEDLRQEKDRMMRENDAMFQEMCMEYEMELDGVKAEAKEKLKKETEELCTAKSQTAVFKKKFDGLNSKIKELKAEKDEFVKMCAKKDKRIEDLERSISALRLEINVRNDTISTSEKKILELKKQTAELEKLRYVLTFKFNELRKEVAPKEEQIKMMNERIQEMDEELEKVGIDRDALKQALGGKDEKIHVYQRNVKKNTQLLDDKERLISLLLHELTELVAENDVKHMVYQLKDIIVKYDSKYQKEDVANERDKTQEFERQRDYMEAQLASMKKQSSRKEEHLRNDNVRKTGENALLVKEINDLRHEKKVLATKLALTEMNLKEAKALAAQQQRGPSSPTPAGYSTGLNSKTPDSMYGGGTIDHGGRSTAWGSAPSRATTYGHTPSPAPSRQSGKLVKGSTRSLRDLSQMDPNKVAEIVATVERNNAEMAKQQEEIRRLRDFVQHLLQRADQEKPLSATPGLDKSQSPTPDGLSQSISLASPSPSPEDPSPTHEVSMRGSSAKSTTRGDKTPTLPDI
mmetsp:Transcript_108172/g.186736  ORF Transcript_108172/g.186736 Transcript_108172/m.186736 type:complete len:1368 (-) Transcript_108172:213-4316(-)